MTQTTANVAHSTCYSCLQYEPSNQVPGIGNCSEYGLPDGEPGKDYADSIIQDMAVAWAENEGYHRKHAQNSFRKHVPEFLSRGMSEAMSVAAWIEHIKASVR